MPLSMVSWNCMAYKLWEGYRSYFQKNSERILFGYKCTKEETLIYQSIFHFYNYYSIILYDLCSL